MNVQLFIPCFVDQLYPTTAFSMVKVLEKTGCTVTYNAAQTFVVNIALQVHEAGMIGRNEVTGARG